MECTACFPGRLVKDYIRPVLTICCRSQTLTTMRHLKHFAVLSSRYSRITTTSTTRLSRANQTVQEVDEAAEVHGLIVVHGHVAAVRAVQVASVRQAAGHHLHVGRVHGVVARADDQR